MTHFLTDADLFDLTGLTQPAAQERFLRAKGYRFDCNARGVPRILWAQVESRQSSTSANEVKNNAGTDPNAGALLQLVGTRKLDRKSAER